MKTEQTANINDFLIQAYETEIGGLQVYEHAIGCALNDELREEWEKYLQETKDHVDRYRDLLTDMGIDPEQESPGRRIVRANAGALVALMRMAADAGDEEAAQLVAAECVVLAEEKCNLNWDLVGELGKSMKGAGSALREAHEEVAEEEKEHLYHTKGWARELWIERLGMPAVVPPPEEEKDVKTAIGAERARMARKEML